MSVASPRVVAAKLDDSSLDLPLSHDFLNRGTTVACFHIAPRRVHRGGGGSPLPMNPPPPPQKFQNLWHARPLRASKIPARPCFIACHVHSTFNVSICSLQSAQYRLHVARGGELLTALSRRGQGGSFRCETVSTASVRKGAIRGEELHRPLFSPCKTRSVECRATVFLVAWHTGKE